MLLNKLLMLLIMGQVNTIKTYVSHTQSTYVAMFVYKTSPRDLCSKNMISMQPYSEVRLGKLLAHEDSNFINLLIDSLDSAR